MVRRLLVLALFSGCGLAAAQGKDPGVQQWIATNQPAVQQEFLKLVSIPDIKTDKPNIARNAEKLRRGISGIG